MKNNKRISTDWSATKLKDAVDCMRRAFYIYVDGVPRKMTVPIVAGLFIHSGCASFNNPQKERRNFKSAESYANQRVGTWKKNIAGPNSYSGKELVEDYEGERWAAASTTIRPCSENFFNIFNDREKPLAVEKRFNVQIGNFVISGSYDVIDKGLVYMDYKTGSRKKGQLSNSDSEDLEEIVKKRRFEPEDIRTLERLLGLEHLSEVNSRFIREFVRRSISHERRIWEPSESDLYYNYQFTLYSTLLPFIISNDPFLLENMELTSSQKRALKKEPFSLIGEVEGKYVRLTTGKVYPTPSRKIEDLIAILNKIESLALMMEQGDFPLSIGHQCSRCLVRDKCMQDMEEGRIVVREDAVVTPNYALFPPRKTLTVHTKMPKNIRYISNKRIKRKRETDCPLFADLLP